MSRSDWRKAMFALLLCAGAGCEAGDAPAVLPAPEAVSDRYGEQASAGLSGNVLQVTVPLADELLRGGSLWRRSGPFFYLFSPATRDLFVEYPDLAGVRVVATDAAGTELARATLRREVLSEFQWREALSVSAVAQKEGTARPRSIEELIYFGQDHTDFTYAPGSRPR